MPPCQLPYRWALTSCALNVQSPAMEPNPLQAWVSAKRYTDEQLADLFKVSRVHAYRLRTIKNRPSVKTARRIEEVTGIPAATLILGVAA